MKYLSKNFIKLFFIAALGLGAGSCVKDFVPTVKSAFSKDMNFAQTEFKPILGIGYNVNVFNDDLSTRPLTFKIVNMRAYDGSNANELLKPLPVEVWKSPYTGEEQSLEEINNKREIVTRPLWEIGLHSGTFTLWREASSDIVRTEPDSCYLFDVEVSNSGGKRYFRNLKLKPQKEIPATGTVSGLIMGDSTRQFIYDTKIWVNRIGEGNAITFKFLDPKLQPIKLSKFNGMTTEDWKSLVHGFDMKFANDSSSVSFNVAYPMPLVPTVNTKYNLSDQAISKFKYNRIAYGGYREQTTISLLYAIPQKGNWEVIVYFPTEAPLFAND